MPEKIQSGAPSSAESIDPISFDDEMIFGLDPAVHWVEWNNQREQFPKIVVEITEHWNDRTWLVKLVERLGYNARVYSVENSTGIFAAPLLRRSHHGQESGLPVLRFFVLRAAGVTVETCHNMFSVGQRSYCAAACLKDVAAKRTTLARAIGPRR